MNENKTNINWFPGHQAKARREISEKIKLVDVVYEVIDSRMPISSFIIDTKEIIGRKPLILVFSKYDLCDKSETDKIIKIYKELGYNTITMNLIDDNSNKIIDYTHKIVDKKTKQEGLKNNDIKAMIIGIPNVGKSTLINNLCGKYKAITSNKPGVTQNLSWINTKSNILLLDTPGILWPKLEDQNAAYTMASFSSIKEEIVNKDELALFIMKKLIKLYPDKIFERYEIKEIDEDYLFYDSIAKKRGAIKKGGLFDYDRVTDIIIKDFKNNYFGNITFDRFDNYKYESELKKKQIKLIAGVDEVGRGPLIGNVVASCVILPEEFNLDGLTDSKKLSEEKREFFYNEIKKQAISIGIGEATPQEIDELNIYEATKLAMIRAIKNCNIKPEHILIDAMKLDIDIPTTSIIKGDLLSISISAASVIAKVYRDRQMYELDKKYPMYNLKNNKGYPTKDHMEAIKKYGITESHRKSYGPVTNYLKGKINE